MVVEERKQEPINSDIRDDDASEQQPLLSGCVAARGTQQSSEQQHPSIASVQQASAAKDELKQKNGDALELDSVQSKELGQCRICLEEDAVANLESPCACTGTQRYAHKDCIQKWVNEKHHTTCEICDQKYKGSYVVPPPPPQGEPLHAVAPLGSLYLTVEDDRMAGQLLSDVYDDWDDHRQPTVSWCFSFMMFLLFMMFLDSTLTITLPDDTTGSSSSSIAGGDSSSPAFDPFGGSGSSEAAQVPGDALAGFAAGASLFIVWLLTKLFLVVLPLLMVLHLAHCAQEEAAAEAAAAAGAVPGLDGPPGVTAAGGSRANPYHTIMARVAAARSGSTHAGLGGSGGNGLADLEMEVLQARRAAMSRSGRDPTFWAPAAATATVGAAPAAASLPVSANAPTAAADQQEQHDATAAEQHMMAAVRAMVRAAVANAAQRELARQQQGRDAEQTAGGSGDVLGRLSGMV